MISIKGTVLQKILNNESGSLDAWSNLKLAYFGTEHTAIYRAISKFYINNGSLPTFEEMDISNRNPILKASLEALKILEIPVVDLDLAVDALLNEYTQNETLSELDSFLDNINMLSSTEIKEELGKVMLSIEEKTLSAEEIVLMNDIEVIKEAELLRRTPLGINNTFDAEVGGFAPTELIAIGGYRGSGKSNVCTNLSVNQYNQGNTTIYFSIEMRAREVFNRYLAIMSGVDLGRLSKAELSNEDLTKIAVVRAGMFQDADSLVEEYYEHNDYSKFEKKLLATKDLKEDNQLIIVDNQHLTLANIDLTLQKFKAKFGDKLKLVVIDYINQINMDDLYDWKNQIFISKTLKSFARKYDIILAAPYQVDKTGEARFSKGILDSVDVAMVIEKSEGRMDFTSTKTRNIKAFKFASPMDESTLRIDADDTNLPQIEEEEEEKPKPSKPAKGYEEEDKENLPW